MSFAPHNFCVTAYIFFMLGVTAPIPEMLDLTAAFKIYENTGCLKFSCIFITAYRQHQVRMTSIKNILQKEVFLPNDERLVGLASVTQAGKKKKTAKHSFLCIASKL